MTQTILKYRLIEGATNYMTLPTHCSILSAG